MRSMKSTPILQSTAVATTAGSRLQQSRNESSALRYGQDAECGAAPADSAPSGIVLVPPTDEATGGEAWAMLAIDGAGPALMAPTAAAWASTSGGGLAPVGAAPGGVCPGAPATPTVD
jgi:hypothetical protein